MPFIVWIVILLGTFENFVPFIIGLVRSPIGSVFLGTVHHPGDYFYYVSQFAQGAYRWFTTVDLYTSEPVSSSIIGWTNALLGHIFALFNISSTSSYQGAILLGSVILFILAYRLCHEILENKWHAAVALYLFVIYHAFPILRDGVPSYGDYFNNFAVPRVRFGAVPHQFILASASIILCYLVTRWVSNHKNRQVKHTLCVIVASTALASLQPALWVLLFLTFSLTASVYILMEKDKWHKLSIYSTPIIFMGLAGIIPLLYLSKLFQTPPFIQLRLWEAAQQTQFSLGHFVSATGPIFLIAIASLPQFLSMRSYKHWFLVIFCFLSFTIFLSPIPSLVGISHVRFMSTLTILGLSIIAAFGINKWTSMCGTFLDKKFSRFSFNPKQITLVLLAGLTLYLLPNHLLTLKLASNFDPTNAYYYINRGDFDLLRYASKVSTPDDVFLVIWPFNSIFPALSARHSYHGHTLLTIDSHQKDLLAAQFFDNKMTDKEIQTFIKNSHISHIITYTWTKLPPGLTILLETKGSLSLYKVNQAYLKPYSK